MLRISYKGRKTVFHLKGLKRRDVPSAVRTHVGLWGREQVRDESGQTVTREVPRSDMIVEWQDGDVWKDDAPTEAIPVE